MARLLVVDDDRALLEGLAEFLTGSGHEVQSALSSQAALAALNAAALVGERLDLIVADVRMPGMDGYELLEAVRAQHRWQDLPFLFISAQDAEPVEEKLTALTRVSLLPKPFDPSRLLEAVDAALLQS